MPRRRDLQDEIEQLFVDLWQVPRFSGLRRGFRPQVDAFRSDDPPVYTIIVELPGLDAADVHVDATSTLLVVTGERRRPQGLGRVIQMELEHGSFQRQLRLPEEVDVAGATATYDAGLLTIVLPVAQRPTDAVSVPIEVRARE
ncbi:MAG: Hsp20/alpha crystallin family protein [Actinomycetota bacterium]|nr:Hsp20/alpha crystallin family protein [Actinomycetota bacterium]